MIWLRILGAPARIFFSDPRDLPNLSGQGSPHELLLSAGTLRSGIGGETPNVSVTLKNTMAQCSRLFTLPPLGATAELRNAEGVIFSGSVQEIGKDNESAELKIEQLLAVPLPLRSSTIWGGFREAVPLPHRYGVTSGELIQYNEQRTIFAWADHACRIIDAVIVNGQPAGEWQWYVTLDANNHAITVVEFGQPQDEGVTLIARGEGKLHPVTGQLMTNPATVIWDVLANIGGRDVSESQLDEFQRDCFRLGIEIGGSIEAADSAQTIVRSICASIGAAFCADAPGLCRIIDGGADPVPRLRVSVGPISAKTALDDMVNDLTVRFGYEAGEPTGSVQLEAPDYIDRFGRRSDDLDAKWVTSSRVAYGIAARLLGARARPQEVVTIPGIKRAMQVFEGVALNHPTVPVTGVYPILSRSGELDSGLWTVTLSVPLGEAPAIRLVRTSIAFDAQQYTAITEQTTGTDRIYTITEADGRPIVGAAVTANGFTRYTDTAGRVAFPISALPPGSYIFQIAALDGRTWPYPTVVT